MSDEIKAPENPSPKKSSWGDFGLGVLAFMGCLMFFFFLMSSVRNASFFSMQTTLMCFGACFVFLFAYSAKAQRPGLILGFVGGIVLSIGALFILLMSYCGGMFR